MARLHDIVFDCAHPAAARFRAAALDEHAVAPYDDAESARLRARGITGTETDPTVAVEDPAGAPWVLGVVATPQLKGCDGVRDPQGANCARAKRAA